MSKEDPWIVLDGKVGETAHCARYGEGLIVPLPQSLRKVGLALDAFCKKHSLCKPGTYVEPHPLSPREWADGRDISVGSMTIYSVMTGMPTRMNYYGTPKDSVDFARCCRFFALFSEYRSRLAEVSERFPEWAALVDHWEELESLYASALKEGSDETLGERIKELNGDLPPAKPERVKLGSTLMAIPMPVEPL